MNNISLNIFKNNSLQGLSAVTGPDGSLGLPDPTLLTAVTLNS